MTDPDLPHLIASAVADAIADVMPPSTTPANLARFESIGAALRRGWDSATPTSTAPVEPDEDSGLHVRVRSFETDLRFESSGDPANATIALNPHEDGIVITLTVEGNVIPILAPRFAVLGALGLRGDL